MTALLLVDTADFGRKWVALADWQNPRKVLLKLYTADGQREMRKVGHRIWEPQSIHRDHIRAVDGKPVTRPGDGLKFRWHPDGGFLAGDPASGRTAYAYPSSVHEVQARREPGRVAENMMRSENALMDRTAWGRERDESNWALLNEYDDALADLVKENAL